MRKINASIFFLENGCECSLSVVLFAGMNCSGLQTPQRAEVRSAQRCNSASVSAVSLGAIGISCCEECYGVEAASICMVVTPVSFAARNRPLNGAAPDISARARRAD